MAGLDDGECGSLWVGLWASYAVLLGNCQRYDDIFLIYSHLSRFFLEKMALEN